MTTNRLGLQQQLKHKLALSPAITESLTVLTLPFDELQDYVTHVVETNPLLDFPHELASPVDPRRLAAVRRIDARDLEPERDAGDAAAQGSARTSASRHDGLARNAASNTTSGADARWDANEGDNPFETVEEHLNLQIASLHLPPRLDALCRSISSLIDDHGYLEVSLDRIAADHACSAEEAERALLIIQSLDPPGVGARSVRECLSLQLDPADPAYPLTFAIVDGDLDAVAQQDIPYLKRKHQASEAEVREALDVIRSLNPRPVSHLARERTLFEVPDIIVERDGGGLRVTIAGDDLETITVDEGYAQSLAIGELDNQTRDYLEEKHAEAAQLMESISQRNATLRRFALYLVDKQAPFFAKGFAALRPLTMQQAADDLGVAVSTVSRIASGKTIYTPWGTVPIKSLFTHRFGNTAGEGASAGQIKELIKRFVAAEDAASPLSDQEIADMVEKQTKAHIARRTVAKYREALGISNRAKRRRR